MSKVWFVTGANSGFGSSIAKAALSCRGPGGCDRPEHGQVTLGVP